MIFQSRNLVVKIFMTEEFNMNSKEMENIKKPSYAVALCKGLFAGDVWQCRKCGGRPSAFSASIPSPRACPMGGNCVWERIG